MFKELKGMEYAIEIIRVLSQYTDPIDAKSIADNIATTNRIQPSQSYLAKVLPRLVKTGILKSSDRGYILMQPLHDISVDKIINMCDMPYTDSRMFKLCDVVKSAMSNVKLQDAYDM